jgi:uncharacterized membrane protein
VRVITAEASYARLVDRSFDKIRQAGRGMPAVLIRQLDALGRIAEYTTTPEQRAVLMHQAVMILRASDESVPEPDDRADVKRRFEALLEAIARRESRSGLRPLESGSHPGRDAGRSSG